MFGHFLENVFWKRVGTFLEYVIRKSGHKISNLITSIRFFFFFWLIFHGEINSQRKIQRKIVLLSLQANIARL